MKRIKWTLLLLAACLLLGSCHRTTPGEQTTKPNISESEHVESTTGLNQPVVEPLDFTYGRLCVENRFVMLSKNDVRFTLNFDKNIFTPGDDIVLLVYVANYTGASLEFGLSSPIVSRQQLIRASLTYGEGQYSVPVTVDYTPEDDLVGGKTELSIRDRKLLAATVTFHTSAYENVEDSIFSEKYADTYQMKFWFGENENDYFIEMPLTYSEQDWTDHTVLQTIEVPESYTRIVGDIRFIVTFECHSFGTDDDIRMHVQVENIGKHPVSLYSDSDISKASYYIRAELSYGDQSVIRDDVAAASEIVGIESRHRLEYGEVLERDITFYTSEFTDVQRSVYNRANRESCALRVWLMVERDSCEIRVPLTYSDYKEYHYYDREVPEITTPAMDTTTVEPETTTEPVTTAPDVTETEPETTAEPIITTGPEETTLEPETITEPAQTTEPEQTDPAEPETTTEPIITTGPEVTTLEPETTAEPTQTKEPEQTSVPESESEATPSEFATEASAEVTIPEV